MADSNSNIQATGGDYTTIQAWIDAKDGETGTHTAHVADEYVDGRGLLNNGATAATAFVIQPQTGAKHDGRSRNVSGSGAALRNTGYVIWWFSSNGATISLKDMILEQTAGAEQPVSIPTAGAGGSIERCVIEKRGTSTGVGVLSGAVPITIHDSVIYGHTTFGLDLRTCTDQDVVGNVVAPRSGSGSFGILPNTGATNGIVANNISVNHPSEDYFGASTNAAHGANIASDISADDEWNGAGGSVNSVEVLVTGGTPTADYVAFVNMTAGSEDFHLVDLEHGTHSNVAIAGGIPSIGSGTDIDGEARDGTTPDIGADEMVSAPPSGSNRRRRSIICGVAT